MPVFNRLCLIALATVFVLGAVPAAAQMPSDNVKTIAGILAAVNHFPGDAEKTTLQAIVDSESAPAAEKAIAQALINMQHTVPAADKEKLEAIVNDETASESVKQLAGILAGINHMVGDEEKAALTKMAMAN